MEQQQQADLNSSPTISSVSSSDLDTESTGSFFHDRSTTLGTLMGVTFSEVPVRPSSSRVLSTRGAHIGGRAIDHCSKERRRRRRHSSGGRSWWRLCRDDMGSTSLRDFLQIERRQLGEHDGHFIYGVAEHAGVGAGPLFEDGRVLPPPPPQRRQTQRAVLLTGICSGGDG